MDLKRILCLFICYGMYSCSQKTYQEHIDREDKLNNKDIYSKLETNSSLELEYQILDENEEDISFHMIGEMAKYPGGFIEFEKFIKNHYIFPVLQDSIEICGKVLVNFSVDTLGRVVDVGIKKGLGDKVDQSCLDVINKVPNWKPSILKHNNKKVKTRFNLPLRFVGRNG